jgi:hypothetical protein
MVGAPLVRVSHAPQTDQNAQWRDQKRRSSTFWLKNGCVASGVSLTCAASTSISASVPGDMKLHQEDPLCSLIFQKWIREAIGVGIWHLSL